MLRVTAVILNWNRRDDTLACVASVRAMTYPVAVVVVDNGSTDGSVAAVREAFPDVAVVQTGENLGYAAGNNAGFDHVLAGAGADAVLLLNNDTEAEPEMLAHLVRAYTGAGGKAVIGPEVRYADDRRTIWCAGGAIDWWRGYTTNIGIGTDAGDVPGPPHDVPFVVGCAMLIPVAALERVGGFDPRYFMYWEEVDWCTRARAAGFGMRVAPAAVLYHKVPRDDGQRPSARVLYYLTRNRLLLLRTHVAWPRKPVAVAWTLWGLARSGTGLARRRDWRRGRALVGGVWDAARGRFGASGATW